MSKLYFHRGKISVVIKRGSVKSACVVSSSAPVLTSNVSLVHLPSFPEPHCPPLPSGRMPEVRLKEVGFQ